MILGLSMLGVGVLLNYRVSPYIESKKGEKEGRQEKQSERFFLWLILGIGIFYLCGDLAYRWIEERSVKLDYLSVLLISSYGAGILFGILFRKRDWWRFRGLFVLGATTLFLSKLLLHFKVFLTILGASLFLLFSVGLMDFLTLNYFVTKFEKIKKLALLYAVIALSLFLGYFLFEKVLLGKEEYMLSFLSVISLATLLLFYRIPPERRNTNIEEIKEETLEPKERLTPQMLMERINSSLPSYTKRLTKRESEVLFYYAVEDKNFREISEILGISRSSVREYLKRASLKLEVPVSEFKRFIKNFLE